MKVAIQGIAGSFHHAAAETLLSKDINIVPCESFRQVFEAVSFDAVDRGLAAVENSLYGSINETYDLLQKYDTWIVGEVYEHVSFGLFSVAGAKLDGITDVYSQAPALGECREYLANEVSWATQHEVYDTAAAAKMVADADSPKKAAISSYKAAQLYNLVPVADNIEDNPHNYTRFVLLSKHRVKLLDANKSSILLTTDHTSGALYKALGFFAEANINLSKIESRPIPGATWNYVFYIDYEAAIESPESTAVLSKLTDAGFSVTELGSYEKALLPSIDHDS